MRYLLGLALILFLTTSAAEAPDGRAPVRFEPLVLDQDRPAEMRVDSLRLAGLWRLTSDNHAFGGISALHVHDGHFLALADSAKAFRFHFDGHDLESPLRARTLPGLHRRPHVTPDLDTEAMTIDPETGQIWAGFETFNTIRRYSANFGRKEGKSAPPAMRGWPENGGSEAMVRLADGRFVVFGEDPARVDGATEGVLFAADPVTRPRSGKRFYYRVPEGFRATDAAQLPDGRLLVLNRHFSVMDGFAAALTLIDPREIVPGKAVRARMVARLAPPLTIDNMEALSVEQGKAGEVVVWIMSDDNFNPLQQTLLMKFTLDPARIR